MKSIFYLSFVIIGDSACVINTNTSSLSSSIIPIRSESSSNSQNYQSSTYFYDIKLAELMRSNQYPPCVHLTSQSFSSDYGFASSEASPSLASSSSSIKLQRQMNINSFISTLECVV